MSCRDKQEIKVYKVGILTSFAPMLDIAEGFKDKMTALGYKEGVNIVYDLQVKDADPDGEKLAVLKFIDDKVDLIFTFPTEASVTAHRLTRQTDIPVVFAMCGIEGNNLVENVRCPGGNITGVRFPGPDNTIKHLEFLLELKSSIKKVWVTYNPNYPNTPVILNMLRSEVSRKGITLIESPNTTAQEVQYDLESIAASGNIDIDAILLLPEALSQSPDACRVIIDFANKHSIPVGGGVPYTLDLGAIFCLLPDEFEMGQMAAPVAHKILNGTQAGSIPLVTPENHLWLNYKAARKLKLNVTEGLIARAYKVIR